MPGVDGFKNLEAQPVALKGDVEVKDVLAENIGEDTENKAMNLFRKSEG